MNSEEQVVGEPGLSSIGALIEQYSALLFDAYGVLVDKAGPLAGACELVSHLNTAGRTYFVLTNSASRLPGNMASGLQEMGLEVPAERLITSGMLLEPYFEAQALTGKACAVLGTNESVEYVKLAGGMPVPAGEDAEVIVIADQAGFPFVETIDAVLSALFRRLDVGQSVHLVLCNPDLVYPFSPGRYGITAGSLAAMLEAVLRERYHDRGLDFVRLGKPYSPIFEEASRRAGTRDMVMFGDQLATDILGARRFGIDSALVLSGLARESTADWPEDMTPNYVLESLAGIEE